MTPRHHQGTILIIVAGIAALLVAIAGSFLAVMRQDGEESALVEQEAQARLMLTAACAYIQECSRLGWDDPDTVEVEEAFGWVDIRGDDPRTPEDESLGPRGPDGRLLFTPGSGEWPAPGSVVRCPMHREQRPPFAISQRVVYNPLPWNPDGLDEDNDAGMRNLWRRWPRFDRPYPEPVAADWNSFSSGDPRPVAAGLAQAWFRVYRELPGDHDGDGEPAYDTPGLALPGHHAIFVVTCGAGGSWGFRDWDEVRAAGSEGLFGSAAAFDHQRRGERLLWYRLEWSAAVFGSDFRYHHQENSGYRQAPLNKPPLAADVPALDLPGGLVEDALAVQYGRNPVGSILWIQRLEQEPPRW